MDNTKNDNQPTKKDVPNRGPQDNFLIVAIGASAGGVKALQEFFEHVPDNSGLAFVVILHLSPDHDSKLTEVLQRATATEVIKVTEKTRIQPNRIFVVPPNQHLSMEDDLIMVSPNLLVEERRAPVDIFFRSLAEAHGPRAVCVVLSGTGANGSMGLKRVKEKGGAAFVQDPAEAEFTEMPRNSIATELVDDVLPVAQLPARIISFRDRLGSIAISEAPDQRPEDQQHALREIFLQLKLRTGHDFSNYKRPTVLRRIERRIHIRALPDLPAYANFLKNQPEEITALLKDLLISVTNFFRDKKAFDVVEREILPILFKKKNSQHQLRIWVAGCATGEEAYSLAMLAVEKALELPDPPKIQVFASDIDQDAITRARDGYYSINDLADVSPERLRHFFNKEGDRYRIRREIRETLMFANHNMLKDPPFSHLDLVACRNVMIYFNPIAQERMIETFHFSLNPGGYLFLGTAESVDGAADLFSAYNRENHIFQSRNVGRRTYPVPETIPAYHFEKPPPIQREQGERKPERLLFGDLHHQLLEQYSFPSLVVNEEYEVVHATVRAARYLRIGGGELSKNVLDLIRPELRLELRSALSQAAQRKSSVEVRQLAVKISGQEAEVINLHVKPALEGESSRGFFLILFEPGSYEAGNTVILETGEPVAHHLEQEIVRLKAELQYSNEQHALQAEELQASNEELQAINEELRSSAEELETSKEELQSINEELRTVNQELKVKIEETSLASNNLKNLINSTAIGTIFLDKSLRVGLFTPAALSIFNLIPADFGRPLSDITHKLAYANLQEDAAAVLDKLIEREREVRTTDGRSFLMRITPYRTAEDRISGVVVTFVEITALKQAQQKLYEARENLEIVLNAADMGIYDVNLVIGQANTNRRHGEIFGYKNEVKQSNRKLYLEHCLPADCTSVEVALERAMQTGTLDMETRIRWPDGSIHWVYDRGRVFYDEDRTPVRMVGITLDITERRRENELLRQSEERLRITMEAATDYAIITISKDGKIEGWSAGAKRIFEYSAAEVVGQPAAIIFTDEDRAAGVPEKEMETAKQTGAARDERWHRRKDGSRLFINGVMRPIYNPDLTGYVKVARDTTDQKLLEQQKDEFISIASHELKTPVTSIKAYTELLKEVCAEEGHRSPGAEMVNRLDDQVNRLKDLVTLLLDSTRITEGQLILEPEQFSLDTLIGDCIDEVRPTTQKHNFSYEYDKDVDCFADKERIAQAVNNLLTNAIKYSPEGGEIKISCRAEKGNAMVTVTDNGVGIQENQQENVFDRFYRATGIQRKFSGIGLGLYITAAIIRRHGGSIGVRSKPGEGASFYFHLPQKLPQ